MLFLSFENHPMKKNLLPTLYLLVIILLASCSETRQKSAIEFNISYENMDESSAFDGRVLLLISDNDQAEPRFQVNDDPESQMVFGIDVENFAPGESVTIDGSVFGYPVKSITDIPDGEYFIQAMLHMYETYQLSNGHIVKLPIDRGEGQKWNISPGNLYSKTQKIRINQGENAVVQIVMDQEIPPVEPPKDTQYIKHIRMQSDLLTDFWGRPVFLQANVLLPHGFDTDVEAEYPLMVFHGHFPATFRGFRTEEPNANPQDSIYNDRFGIYGYEYIQQKEAFDLYRQWISPDFPRFLVIEIQHQNPYYDDSYAVNSANLGPYGDAITYELIPYIENMFRGVGEGWGRFLYGGSTGGWEALAAQVFYPDEYNGCFAACPDPIDFRAYTVVNIYEDKNAYYLDGDYNRTPRPGKRDKWGHVFATLEETNHRELALGTNSRSGDQWDIWQAVYSPVGDDGYPRPIWDKLTGEIDHETAVYWQENYDLRYIMERDWGKIGSSLEGKIHIYCGDMDNYYLNNAVKLTEEFLENTSDPYYKGEVDFGDGFEHCWNGDHDNPNHISRLRYNTMYLPKIRKRLESTAPPDHTLINWDL